MFDSLQGQQTFSTVTTTTNNTGIDLLSGTPRRGLKMHFDVSSFSAATAGTTWIPTVQDSTDNTTFVTIATGPTQTATTAGVAKELYVPFETSNRYVRASTGTMAATNAPSLIYSARLTLGRPA